MKTDSAINCENCAVNLGRSTPAVATYEGHPICPFCLLEAAMNHPSVAARVLKLIREDPAFGIGDDPLREILPPEVMAMRTN